MILLLFRPLKCISKGLNSKTNLLPIEEKKKKTSFFFKILTRRSNRAKQFNEYICVCAGIDFMRGNDAYSIKHFDVREFAFYLFVIFVYGKPAITHARPSPSVRHGVYLNFLQMPIRTAVVVANTIYSAKIFHTL